jgi:hypothetical protein
VTLRLVFALTLAAVAASPAKAQPRAIEPYRDPNLAAIKSMVLPGWGQFANEQPNKGAALVTNAIVGLLLATDTVSFWSSGSGADLERALGWLAYGLGAVAGGYDAYKNAAALNRENGYLLDEAAAPGRGRDRQLRVVVWRHRF